MATKSKRNAAALADALAQHRPPKRVKTWLDKLPADKRARLAELKRRFQAGEYANLPGGISEIHRFCCDKEGLSISRCEFSRWLKA